MTNFGPFRHESTNTRVQCSPVLCEKWLLKSTRPPKQKRLSRVFAIFRSRISAILSRMADIMHADAVEQPSVVECEEKDTLSEQLADQDQNLPKQVEEQPQQPAVVSPTHSSASESAGSYVHSDSPSAFSSPLYNFDVPPTPRLRTCELPKSPSIVTSPLPLRDLLSHEQPKHIERVEEACPEEPVYDPFSNEPLFHPFADNWASLDRSTSLSLTAEPSDEESWPFDNALGLYVDPAMNIATWDAAGFIRATAPSPSPSRFRAVRQRTQARSLI